MTTTNLSAKVAEFKRLCEQRQETVVQKSLIRTGTSAIVESPVDQGRFVAGWNFAFGAEDTSIRGGEFSGEAERMGSINRLTSTLSGIELGMVFYFSNPLPYAQRLEQGWSAKSSKMVARAVNNFPAIVAEEVSKAK